MTEELYDPYEKPKRPSSKGIPPLNDLALREDPDRPPRTEDLIPRHGGNGLPKIWVPDGSRMEYYSRPSSWGEKADDGKRLGMWHTRKTVSGYLDFGSQSTTLRMERAALGPEEDNKEGHNALNKRAKNLAFDRDRVGTALHKITEKHDLGLPMILPEEFADDLVEWVRLTRFMKIIDLPTGAPGVECFVTMEHPRLNPDGSVVLDAKGRPVMVTMAGTFDRLLEYLPCPICGRRNYIADLKGLALDTPLPTPTGWTTMDEVRPGDQLLGKDGLPCSVTQKSLTKRIGTYIVTFSDGATIICDSEHLWETTTGQPAAARTTIKDVETIRDTLWNPYGARDHRVTMPSALDLSDAKLPIDPYVLGVWLGDGAARGGTICKQADLFAILESDGVSLGIEQAHSESSAISRTIHGLTTQLRHEELLHNKHIPSVYLRASRGQRLRLLQGLMDTGGTWNKPRRRAIFNSTQENLAREIEELLLTLGQQPHISSAMLTGFGVTVRCWAVEFTPVDLNPFRLPRKANQASASTKNTTHARRRVIVAVEPGPDVETACVAVDSADRMYLAGRRMVPTHNTGALTSFPYSKRKSGIQLGIYSRGEFYIPWPDGRGTDRYPLPDICQHRGIIISLPAGSGSGSMHWVDIARGFQRAVTLIPQIHEHQAEDDWTKEFTPVPNLRMEIDACTSRAQIQALWHQYPGELWTADDNALTLHASARINALEN